MADPAAARPSRPPRPVVLLHPAIDYQSNAAELARCFATAGRTYTRLGKSGALQLIEVDDYVRYSRRIADEVVRHLQRLAAP